MGYHDAIRTIEASLRVDVADKCIWLVDERGDEAQTIHLTPDQAITAGEALQKAGEEADDGKSLTVPVWDTEEA